MALNIEIIKKTSVYSAALGALLAVLALIPALMPAISLFILPFLSALIIFSILRITEKNLPELEIKEYAVLGAGIGGIAGFSFLIIFTPLVLLIHLVFKDYYAYGINYLNFFVAFVFIITNAGGGLLSGFLIKQIDKFRK